ncbi:hypothetical protein MTO96_043453, partial [Rhipicephalus appendiculatus]
LPDVTDLTLVSTGNTSFTVSWERPKYDFDYYLVEVTDNTNGDVEPYRVGSCANGSIIDAHQTQVTCNHIEPCANVTFRIRTYAKGPPERVSSGVALDGIFIPGQAPGSPSAVFLLWSKPTMSRIRWRQPDEVYGPIQGYRVRICQQYRSCEVEQEIAGCEEYRTSRNDLHWDTTRGTLYCVLVSATARCGGNLITGRPVAAEIMAHFSASPRVTNLSLVSAKDRSFTLSWKRPREKFDYYRVQVTSSGGVLNVVPDSPNNVSIMGISPSLSRLQWEPPENVSDNLRDYTVRICSWHWPCDAERDLTVCSEHGTSNNWFDFETKEGTFYCVHVKASTLCGDQVIAGLPATAEVVAPFLGEKTEE